jgi:hypothetical protein
VDHRQIAARENWAAQSRVAVLDFGIDSSAQRGNEVMDKQQFSCAVLGSMTEVLLVELDRDGYPASEAAVLAALERGLRYAGCIGYYAGTFAAKAEPGCSCALAVMQAAPGFAAYVASKLQQPKSGDSIAWLETLYALEAHGDTR